MVRYIRLAAAALAVAASFLASAPADAQVACDTLPNPIVVSGSSEFEAVLKKFAVKLAAESQPITIISIAGGGQSASCAAVKGLVEGTDFGGLPGRYYTLNDMMMIVDNPCTLSPGQTSQVAISNVFYESCSNVPQPKPADITDVTGPAQAAVFVSPNNQFALEYITYEEAGAIYGCGVSSMRTIAGSFSNPATVFCLNSSSGAQVTVARNTGLDESAIVPPICNRTSNDPTLVLALGPMTTGIGFISADVLDGNRGQLRPLAFRALHQTKAFYPDSGPTVADRKNVRDGHYPLWRYVHLIARTTSGNLSPQVSDLIGWITGAKTSPNIDPVVVEAGSGLTPQCAMKVKRSADGGPLSPYSPSRTCNCVFEALNTRSTPAGCTPCGSDSGCPCGLSCQHGFCE